MTTNRQPEASNPDLRLHLAFDLGWTTWTLAFTTGHGQPPRLRTMRARDLDALLREIGIAGFHQGRQFL